MIKPVFRAFLVVAVWCAFAPHHAQAASAQLDAKAMALLQQFFTAESRLQSAMFRLRKVERMRNGKSIEEEAFVKFKKPGMLYMAALKPRQGQEVIYNPLKDKHKLTAHRGSFPDLTVNISIHGRLALADQHHPVYHTGFSYMAAVLKRGHALVQGGAAGERITYAGTGQVDGRPVEKVLLFAGQREPREEAARKGESLIQFGKRMGMDPHVILMANPEIGALHSDLKEGQIYKVPQYYAHKTELWFDKATSLPIRQAMYDPDGNLYELYEYFDLVVDPPLTDADFDPENSDYNF